jgi:hypothetical protein
MRFPIFVPLRVRDMHPALSANAVREFCYAHSSTKDRRFNSFGREKRNAMFLPHLQGSAMHQHTQRHPSF